jgi:hypothetical protein
MKSVINKVNKCKHCGLDVEVNQYGFCKPCVEKRARQIIVESKNRVKQPSPQPPTTKTTSPVVPTAASLNPINRTENEQKSDPLGLSKVQYAHTSTDSIWKKTDDDREVAHWIDLPSELKSHIDQTHGFATEINGISYRYRRSGDDPDYGIVQRWKKQNTMPTKYPAERQEQPAQKDRAIITSNNGERAQIDVYYEQERVASISQLTRTTLDEEQQASIIERLFTLGKNKDKKTDFIPMQKSKREIGIFENTLIVQIYIRYGRQFVRTISGGNYDFMSGTDTGYLVTVSCQADDDYLLKNTITLMRKMSFACHMSNYSAYCFLADKIPTLAGQKELLDRICQSIVKMVYDREY